MTHLDDVLQAQRRFDDPERVGDRVTLDELIHADFASIGPKGFVLDKEKWIGRHDFFRYHELDISEPDARLFGDTAIIRNIQRNHADSSGHEVRVNTRVSQVWIEDAGAWRIVAIQFSPLAEA
nr:nuclear transport factor 2 family protein [Propionicimonas sp.]